MTKRKYLIDNFTIDELSKIINDSSSYKESFLKIGYKRTTQNALDYIKQIIKDNSIDISHFRNYNQMKSMTLVEIMVENSNYNNQLLKERLIKDDLLEYKCVECCNEGIWNNKLLTLQLDHINGINNDHRLENLRFLCANCHSQTSTFSGRNIKK